MNTCASASVDSAVIKQLGILRRPRYVHRGSRRGYMYSRNGGEFIPSLWSRFPVRSGVHSTRHRNTDSYGPIEAAVRRRFAEIPGVERGADSTIRCPSPLTRMKTGGKSGVDFSVLHPLSKL